MTELSMQVAELLPAREALSTVHNILVNIADADSEWGSARASANQTAVVLTNAR
jgi:hypothetical protein